MSARSVGSTESQTLNSAHKNVLVTGAARRLGRSIALDLARHGWSVAIHYHSSSADAESVAEEISAAGGTAKIIKADLADAHSVHRLIRSAADLFGPLTCLINNASAFEDDRADAFNPQLWQKHMDINLRAPVMLAEQFHEHLPRGVEGVVVNLIDQRVWRPTPEYFSYTLSKCALWTATRTMAQTFAPRVRVNAIGPGPVLQSIHQTPEDFQRECRATPLGHGATTSEIAKGVRFILDAPAMTGQMIVLDGGQHLAWNAMRAPDGG